MAKYYIQSGNASYIVGACDAEGAALWAMHRIMDEKICDHEDAMLEQELDPYGEFDSDIDERKNANLFQLPIDDSLLNEVPQAIPYEAMLDGLAQFDETINVSERGFGYDDAGKLETEGIFHQWRQLMLAVDRLHDGRK